MNVKEILKKLTVEEKAALVSGTDFMYTNRIPRLNIPSLRMSDGPHGLRVQTEGGDNGVTGSLPATAFPTAACAASGWNPENLRKMGAAIARECRKYGVHIVLGPGVNIKRNPLAGRNFEYFSEDPLLAGKLAAAEVEGIQSEGVGACVKHFALNNTENYRFVGDSVADVRAVREIYFKPFEIVVKEAKPAALMSAYNKVNGEFCAQNKWLLSDVLRGEWGFEGLVMTDWGAMHDRVKSLAAGLDLEMPGDTAICRRRILDGVADGSLGMAELDKAAENVLNAVARYVKTYSDDSDLAAHDRLACEIAKDCAVLLQNDGTLPLSQGEKVFVAGDLFEDMRYQGAGSSMINPAKLTSPKAAFDEAGVSYAFSRGYAANGTEPDRALIAEAVGRAAGYRTAIVFAGLTDYAESEGCDRTHMRLPENQLALIDALIGAGKKVAVVLFGGSPVELPFADEVSAILNMYLPGQSGGRACADLLFGKAEPAGRLAETWPLSYRDVPFGDTFGKGEIEVYRESVFVGYRYFLSANKAVRYPFGYGLSYTSFAYADMRIAEADGVVTVSCTLQNTGARDGAEVVQLYVKAPESDVFKPVKELRDFRKVYLRAGASETVSLSFAKDELRFFHAKRSEWVLEGGAYELQICSDCTCVRLAKTLQVEASACDPPYGAETVRAYRAERLAALTNADFEAMSGLKIPAPPPQKPLTLESRFCNFRRTFWGRILFNAVMGVAKRRLKAAKKLPQGAERENKIKGALFLQRVFETVSVISMTMSAGRRMPYPIAEGLVALANGKIFRAIRCFCRKIKVPPLPKERGNKRT